MDILAQQVFYRLPDAIQTLPDEPGVYLFYHFQKSSPIYIGKSKHLKQRIKSHYQSAKTIKKSFKITHFAEKLGFIPTLGDLGAQLLEALLVKQTMPLYNRRLTKTKQLSSIQLVRNPGYHQVKILSFKAHEWHAYPNRFGVFRNPGQARIFLEKACQTHGLCQKTLGLESASPGPCFAYQCKQCYGACINAVKHDHHNKSLQHILSKVACHAWPYNGPIWIYQKHDSNHIERHLVDQWQYIKTETTINHSLRVIHNTISQFDKDIYHILVSGVMGLLKQELSFQPASLV